MNFREFPRLVIDSKDAANSCMYWLSGFNLCVEFTTMQIDKAEGGQVNCSSRIKLLAQLSAIDKGGHEALQSVGFSLESHDSTYEQAIEHLNIIDAGEETVYFRSIKFVTCSKAYNENERDDVLRVDKLSRNLNLGGDVNRKDFAFAIDLNELRESMLRRQLVWERDLDWGWLSDTL